MDFFKSEVVQREMDDIYKSYRRLERLRVDLPTMAEEERKQHVEEVKELIERQKIFYMRMSLTSHEDEEVFAVKERMDMIAQMMGFPNYIGSLDAMIRILDDLLTKADK